MKCLRNRRKIINYKRIFWDNTGLKPGESIVRHPNGQINTDHYSFGARFSDFFTAIGGMAMFNSVSLENQAFYLSRIIYRDTVIEDYHHDGAVLGADGNVKKVRRCHRRMLDIQSEGDADSLLRRMSAAERDEFVSYCSCFNFLSKCRCNWDPPEKLEISSIPNNLSVFILDGHFSECCKKHSVLTDPVMRYINKDIYNRVYTLMRMDILP